MSPLRTGQQRNWGRNTYGKGERELQQHSLDYLELNRQRMEEETERRKAGFASRPCPQCGEQRMKRVRTRPHLRALRKVGIHYRTYNCTACERQFRLKAPPEMR